MMKRDVKRKKIPTNSPLCAHKKSLEKKRKKYRERAKREEM
jgi:hypothetical protein